MHKPLWKRLMQIINCICLTVCTGIGCSKDLSPPKNPPEAAMAGRVFRTDFQQPITYLGISSQINLTTKDAIYFLHPQSFHVKRFPETGLRALASADMTPSGLLHAKGESPRTESGKWVDTFATLHDQHGKIAGFGPFTGTVEVVFVSDSILLAWGRRGMLKLADTVSNESIDVENDVHALAISHDRKNVIIARPAIQKYELIEIEISNTQNKQFLASIPADRIPVALSSTDASVLVLCAARQSQATAAYRPPCVYKFDRRTRSIQMRQLILSRRITTEAMALGRSRVAICFTDEVLVFDASTGESSCVVRCADITHVAFSADDNILYCARQDELSEWRIRGGSN